MLLKKEISFLLALFALSGVYTFWTTKDSFKDINTRKSYGASSFRHELIPNIFLSKHITLNNQTDIFFNRLYLQELIKAGKLELALDFINTLGSGEKEEGNFYLVALEIYIRFLMQEKLGCDREMYAYQLNQSAYLDSIDLLLTKKNIKQKDTFFQPLREIYFPYFSYNQAKKIYQKLSELSELENCKTRRKNIQNYLNNKNFKSSLGGGSILEDFNNDGFVDLVISEMGLDGNLAFYLNDKEGHFTSYTNQAFPSDIKGGSHIVQTDFNNDGWLDIFITRGAWFGQKGLLPNILLKNNGDNTFSDVTIASGLKTSYPSQVAVWSDYNNDGWLDLFIGNEDVGKLEIHSEFYLNNRNGTFSNITRASGLNFRAKVKGATALDYNNDSQNDLFITTFSGYNLLFENQYDSNQGVIFRDVSDISLENNKIGGYICGAFDFNNDGLEDIIHSFPIDTKDSLYGFKILMNAENGVFAESNQQFYTLDNYVTGLAIGDFDNNSFLDIYSATTLFSDNQFFYNHGANHFQRETSCKDYPFHLSQGNGISCGDVDNNGMLDYFINNGGFVAGDKACDKLFFNSNIKNNWITIDLKRAIVNKSAIGVKIILTLNSKGKKQKIYRKVNTGASLSGSSLPVEFGLRTATVIDSLEVHWSKSDTSYFFNVEANQHYQLIEGDSLIVI